MEVIEVWRCAQDADWLYEYVKPSIIQMMFWIIHSSQAGLSSTIKNLLSGHFSGSSRYQGTSTWYCVCDSYIALVYSWNNTIFYYAINERNNDDIIRALREE